MRALSLLASLAAAATVWLTTPTVSACGGFFCGSSPVDQAAERVVFTVHEDRTDMVVQIAYQGRDQDFAWLLPLVDVPDVESLDVFPQTALSTLDANTGPNFTMPLECLRLAIPETFISGALTGTGALTPAADDVTVHVREEVGPYDVAVVSSEDPEATSQWLRDNGYNIADSMQPYIELYTQVGMKFLALRLTADSEAGDISPFKLSLPGSTPGIPLRLTSVAAEPEMGIKVWIFAGERFEPANAEEVKIDTSQLRWKPDPTGPLETNYSALVAREVDQLGGRAWVAEMAGDTTALRRAIETTPANTPELQRDQQALLEMIGDSSYVTRLYTRLSPEEMIYDPLFKRSNRGDVDRNIELPYVEELCGEDLTEPLPLDPCVFAACGRLGLCRPVMDEETETEVAGCACAPGATARTTLTPDGVTPMVSCQDERLSFINPGDRLREDAERLPDPCVGFDCGEHGRCVSMNLTPTCECEEGFVATGSLSPDGTRTGHCAVPLEPVPDSFYNRRPTERPEEMPVGRDMPIDPPQGPSDIEMEHTEPNIGADAVESSDGPADDPREGDPARDMARTLGEGGGCSARPGAMGHGWLLGLLGLGLVLVLRRAPRRA